MFKFALALVLVSGLAQAQAQAQTQDQFKVSSFNVIGKFGADTFDGNTQLRKEWRAQVVGNSKRVVVAESGRDQSLGHVFDLFPVTIDVGQFEADSVMDKN